MGIPLKKLLRAHPQDGEKINVRYRRDIARWCNVYGVSKERLIEAVREVGTSSEAVRKYLGIKGKLNHLIENEYYIKGEIEKILGDRKINESKVDEVLKRLFEEEGPINVWISRINDIYETESIRSKNLLQELDIKYSEIHKLKESLLRFHETANKAEKEKKKGFLSGIVIISLCFSLLLFISSVVCLHMGYRYLSMEPNEIKIKVPATTLSQESILRLDNVKWNYIQEGDSTAISEVIMMIDRKLSNDTTTISNSTFELPSSEVKRNGYIVIAVVLSVFGSVLLLVSLYTLLLYYRG